MIAMLFVFGTTMSLAYWLSRKSPLGFRYSVLIAAIVAVFAPIIGFACGGLLAYTGPAEITPNEYIANGLVTGVIAMIAAPFFVAYCRRKPPINRAK
ncbi:hypothetical protein D3Y55_05245 [Mesorhizobium sp. DCY119]|nr:hypothetical protein D3Y55_05245 [Mesorhizobium sp. DCY119]